MTIISHSNMNRLKTRVQTLTFIYIMQCSYAKVAFRRGGWEGQQLMTPFFTNTENCILNS